MCVCVCACASVCVCVSHQNLNVHKIYFRLYSCFIPFPFYFIFIFYTGWTPSSYISRWVLQALHNGKYVCRMGCSLLPSRLTAEALVVCDSDWMSNSVALHSAFWTIHWNCYITAVWLLCGCSGATWNCCRLGALLSNHAPFTLKCRFIRSHIAHVGCMCV